MGIAVTSEPVTGHHRAAGGRSATTPTRVRRYQPPAHAQPRDPRRPAHRSGIADAADDPRAALRALSRIASSSPPARDADSWRVMPGVEFAPQALIKGSAYVGHRKFTPLLPRVLPEFSGVVADLGLSYTLLGSTVFGVSYRRDLTYSYSSGSRSSSTTRRRVRPPGARAPLRRPAVGRSAHSTTTRNSPDPPGPDPSPRIDTTWLYAASLGYRLRPRRPHRLRRVVLERESTTARFRQYTTCGSAPRSLLTDSSHAIRPLQAGLYVPGTVGAPRAFVAATPGCLRVGPGPQSPAAAQSAATTPSAPRTS
jgi:hypothetical protein